MKKALLNPLHFKRKGRRNKGGRVGKPEGRGRERKWGGSRWKREGEEREEVSSTNYSLTLPMIT